MYAALPWRRSADAAATGRVRLLAWRHAVSGGRAAARDRPG